MSATLHPFWLIIGTAIVALIPVLMGLVTSYVKVSIVLSMIRNALGTQQVPGTLVIMALSLALTLLIMGPVFDQTLERAKAIDFGKLATSAPSVEGLRQFAQVADPWRDFLLRHSSQREITVFRGLAAEAAGKAPSDGVISQSETPALRVLVPAFVLTELKEAFAMGFVVLLPFLVIDLIIANVLAGMGMMMMSPVLISLPVKLIVFVLTDGWLLIVRGLIHSYQ